MKLLIGLSGKARSGKDTVGNFLKEYFKKNYRLDIITTAYADTLKSKVMADFDLSFNQVYGDQKEVLDHRYTKGQTYWTPRQIMQEYGQFFRTIEHDFWVRKLFENIEETGYDGVIVTDIRHKNEIDAIVERDGFHIRIERPDFDNKLSNTQHVSETALDNGDYVTHYNIRNDGSLEDLFSKAQSVVNDIITQVGKKYRLSAIE